MILNYSKDIDRAKGNERHKYLIENEKKVEYKALSNSRSARQNRAMHKFFNIIAEKLKNQGLEHNYVSLDGEIVPTMFTWQIIKNFVWRPIQIALFDIESTKDIDTKQINDISDVIIKHFGQSGYRLVFPSIKWIEDNE